VVDVFTDRPLEGNPLGVVLDAEGLSDDEMGAIAREFNLSETTFVLPPTSPQADYRMRIFTPTRELPFAGHPSIGTAHLLAEEGVLPLRGELTTVRQQLELGVLPLEVHARDGRPTRVVMTQGRPELGEPYGEGEVVELLAALGLPPSATRAGLPARPASTGIWSLLLPLDDIAALGRLEPDPRALATVRGMEELSVVYAFALAEGEARARAFAPHLGVGEDAATGSAAGALGAYLWAHDALPKAGGALRFRVRQGVEMRRPSLIEVEVNGDDAPREVRVGGQAVTVLRGELSV
jgi:trans-2,3-dihydro-3-hydroxyanthranilate isomerase